MADEMTDRTLIYIWCGVLSGLWVVLAICIIVIFLKVRNVGEVSNSHPNTNKNPKSKPQAKSVKGNDVYNYGSSGIVPGEDLAKRGFSQHAPKNSKPDSDPDDIFYSEDYSYSGSTLPTPRAPTTNNNPQAQHNSNFIY